MALALLENKNGVIRLKVPIRGIIDDPQFDISDAIQQATSSIVLAGLETTVKILFPPAAIAGGVFDLLSHLTDKAALAVPALNFIPNEITPSQSGDTRSLQHLSTLLLQHPNINVTICGISTGQDQISSDSIEGYTKLARSRAVWAKQVILEKEPSLDGSRILLCQTANPKDSETPPRLEFRIK